MVSIDGLGAAALADQTIELPTLRALGTRGATARRLTPVFPSVTWPRHTSIVTGVSPARHGVLGNMVFERQPVLHGAERVRSAPRPVAVDGQLLPLELGPEPRRGVALEEFLFVELPSTRPTRSSGARLPPPGSCASAIGPEVTNHAPRGR